MSFRVITLLLVAMLAFTIAEAFPARTLLHEQHCEDACDAAQENDPDEVREIIDQPHDICDCQCNYEGWTPMHVAARYNCIGCFEVRKHLVFRSLILVVYPAFSDSTIQLS